MQHNKWYIGYHGSVAEIDAEIQRRQRIAIFMAMKAKGDRPRPRETTLKQEADLWKIRESRRAS